MRIRYLEGNFDRPVDYAKTTDFDFFSIERLNTISKLIYTYSLLEHDNSLYDYFFEFSNNVRFILHL